MTLTTATTKKVGGEIRGFALLAALALALSLALAGPAHAATLTVNSLDDGSTSANDGKCTLREAITSANTDTASGTAAGECAAGSGADVIDVGVTGTLNLVAALPALSTNIEIDGPGADQLTVTRPYTAALFGIFNVTGDTTVVTISGITITNGAMQLGGGIANNGGTLTVTDSTISGNYANFGGGIVNLRGTLTVIRSTIRDNSVSGDGGNGGGGIASETSGRGQTTITNSTISGNAATARGGGVLNFAGLTVVEHSTITNNTAPSANGSGVDSSGDASTRTEVLSTIISANQGTDVDSGTTNSFVSKGYNLIGDGNATGAFNQTSDQTGKDPGLDPLGSFGGPTQTHRLRSDSLAIDAGPPTGGDTIACPPPATDQRGVERPQDGNADSTLRCDIGSFERAAPSSANSSTITINDNGETAPLKATPYPSTIEISGPSTTGIQDVNLTLKGYTHTWPDDVGVLLVGPEGQKALVMSDVGAHNDVSGIDLTLDDEATSSLPNSDQITAGTYKPTQGTLVNNTEGSLVPADFPLPAPTGPYATDLSVFDGTNPNGTWSLYVIDDTFGDAGQFAGGWSLEITTTDSNPDTTAPRVRNTVPKAKAVDIARTSNVKATFSENMDASTITGQTFKLFKKGSTQELAATVSYSESTHGATLNPTNSLQRGATYKAVVTTGAKDLAGNRLDQDQDPSNGLQKKAWTFTIRN